MFVLMKKFPWFEVALIVGLAIALIVRPESKTHAETPDRQGSTLLPVTASTQPRAGL
ncbi:MAG: hypothetical protein ABIP55_01355 [Tepidisphaeraceae bacterium]